MRLKTFLVACSLLAGCAKIQRPDADICVVNAPGKKLTCYNLERDYNEDGQLKPGVQPHFKPAPDVEALNKYVAMSSPDFGKFKAYIKKLREEYESGCK